MTTLYFRDGSSDKVYSAEIVPTANNLFNVAFAYGRRGSTLTTGQKNTAPLPRAEAQAMLDKLLREKMAKGYTEGQDAPIYTATSSEDRFTGILPMLLNSIDESELPLYLNDDAWIAQEKFDGKRIMLRKNADGSVDAINRKGLLSGAPETILAEARKLPGQFILDGECIGETFHAFDYISPLTLWDRSHQLYRLLNSIPVEDRPHIQEVTSVQFHKKRELLALLKERNAEGIVFKHVDRYYHSGRPNHGGDALKFKFKARHTFLVSGINDKRSASLCTLDHDDFVPIGNVSIPPNQDIPRPGDLVDVEYLYAFKGGSLFQPVYKGKRDDITVIDDIANLKYKAGEEENE